MATEALRVRVEGVGAEELRGWEIARLPAGGPGRPDELVALAPEWLPVALPATAASALAAAGRWTFDDEMDFDAHDWWFRCRFAAAIPAGTERLLHFGGLATIADVWLNGVLLLHSSNMFHASEREVSAILREQNDLLIRCRALQPLFALKRPRPRWRTRLVEAQALRWFRTTLLGRMPGWSPPAAPVGPWRPIVLRGATPLAVDSADIGARLEGNTGVITVTLRVRSRAPVVRATLLAGALRAPLALRPDGDGTQLTGELRLESPAVWWPHTHGAQPRYGVRVVAETAAGEVAIDCGRVGFRSIDLLTADGDFALHVNGRLVFCRGACWTPLDVVRLSAPEAGYREALELARDAGMNMLRVGGTMVYEDDVFYELCDELGILVWQDFMLANMDYPASDDAFLTSLGTEAGQLLRRLQGRPSLAVLCGGSEVEQQAAMLGLPRDTWSGPLFSRILPELCRQLAPGVPYWPSSPSGGPLPFHANRGATHYYGVGAYLRPLEDARRAEVRFASECLAFANVPDPATVHEVLGPPDAPERYPRWKRRIPRDAGTSWDFEDVRDHYVGRLFGVDPEQLRHADMERYLALGRIATGEVMAMTFAEWRRARSTCRGALVFLFRDLWPGAGWGVIDSHGRPKAAYYYLKRVLQPVALLATDEGVNGLALHIVNETAVPLDGELRLALYRDGETQVGAGCTRVRVPAGTTAELAADTLLEGFRDITYSYRFGSPGHNLVVVTLDDAVTGRPLGETCFFPTRLPSAVESDVGLEAAMTRDEIGWVVTMRTRRFAQAVVVDVPGYRPDDNYFHLPPAGARRVRLHSIGGGDPPHGWVGALNSRARARLTLASAIV